MARDSNHGAQASHNAGGRIRFVEPPGVSLSKGQADECRQRASACYSTQASTSHSADLLYANGVRGR